MLLDLRSVTMTFGGLKAPNDPSFQVDEGEIVGLVGANGAGKSTLLGVVSGALRPRTGSVHFAGCDITGWPPHKSAGLGLARTFQLVQPLTGLTSLDCVMLGALYGSVGGRTARLAVAR